MFKKHVIAFVASQTPALLDTLFCSLLFASFFLLSDHGGALNHHHKLPSLQSTVPSLPVSFCLTHLTLSVSKNAL